MLTACTASSVDPGIAVLSVGGARVASGAIGEIETISVNLLSDYAAHPDGALSWRFDPEFAGTGVLATIAGKEQELMLDE